MGTRGHAGSAQEDRCLRVSLGAVRVAGPAAAIGDRGPRGPGLPGQCHNTSAPHPELPVPWAFLGHGHSLAGAGVLRKLTEVSRRLEQAALDGRPPVLTVKQKALEFLKFPLKLRPWLLFAPPPILLGGVPSPERPPARALLSWSPVRGTRVSAWLAPAHPLSLDAETSGRLPVTRARSRFRAALTARRTCPVPHSRRARFQQQTGTLIVSSSREVAGHGWRRAEGPGCGGAAPTVPLVLAP